MVEYTEKVQLDEQVYVLLIGIIKDIKTAKK